MNTGTSDADGSIQAKSDTINATWKAAVALRESGRLSEAVRLWESLLVWIDEDIQPGVHSALADCYEKLGQLETADRHLKEAVRIEPWHSVYRGGYASFLYLHGDPSDALDEYLATVQIEAMDWGPETAKQMAPAIHDLGKRLGMSERDVERKIAEAIQKGLRKERPPAPNFGDSR